MIKVKIFIVERYCPKDQETDRIKLCKKKGLIFPFKILVTDELDPCRNCGKRAWRIDGRSLKAFERRYGLAHIETETSTICETAGHLENG